MKNSDGFTLVELAIVMVIMGLLVSGAVAGKSLYHTSQIRATITEIENSTLAVKNFTLQYGAIPGDINNATSLWPDSGTKNGNNDGKIDASESFRAWEQLALAKMIAGHYSGVGPSVLLGSNIPRTHYLDGGYQLAWQDAPGGWKDAQGRAFLGNYLLLANEGIAINAAPVSLTKPLLIPEDGYAIDSKLDNGKPDSGSVLASDGEGDKACTLTNEYNFSLTIPTCVLYIKQ